MRVFRWSGAEDFKLPLFSELIEGKVSNESAGEIKERILDRLLQ
jgi:hypothetical protein